MKYGYPKQVRIVEVGPRDGLQNEPNPIPTPTKVEFINRLSQTGLTYIETSSFVSPKWVPQLADAAEVFNQIERNPNITYSALTPNLKGFERALDVRAQEVAIFAAASESFAQKNTNCSIAESIERFQPIIAEAQKHQLPVRGYLSCVLGCPYEGAVSPQKVAELAQTLFEMGCYEVSLGDTIGVGTPLVAQSMVQRVSEVMPLEHIAIHFHDTRGQALANIFACLQLGVSIIDASVSGLGGCPYAKGASGNVATEDVVYMLQGMGIETGIDLTKLIQTSQWISQVLERTPNSRLGRINN